MASRYGWGADQFSCLNSLWNRESGWNVHAANSSGAYGIPQALPGSKMATAGADWRDNPATQIAWGLSYVKSTLRHPVRRLVRLPVQGLVLTPLGAPPPQVPPKNNPFPESAVRR